LKTLENFPASNFDGSTKPTDVLVARCDQPTSIFLPLYKPFTQLALTGRRELFRALG
jgi:hypothetical protein